MYGVTDKGVSMKIQDVSQYISSFQNLKSLTGAALNAGVLTVDLPKIFQSKSSFEEYVQYIGPCHFKAQAKGGSGIQIAESLCIHYAEMDIDTSNFTVDSLSVQRLNIMPILGGDNSKILCNSAKDDPQDTLEKSNSYCRAMKEGNVNVYLKYNTYTVIFGEGNKWRTNEFMDAIYVAEEEDIAEQIDLLYNDYGEFDW